MKKKTQSTNGRSTKSKKKKFLRPLNLKVFPGYDLHITMAIFVLVAVLVTCTGCYSPDTVYVREYYRPSPFSTSFINHRYHYDHHHHHHHRSSRKSSAPVNKTITPTRNPNPPPSRPISKGVPEPPSNPRERR